MYHRDLERQDPRHNRTTTCSLIPLLLAAACIACGGAPSPPAASSEPAASTEPTAASAPTPANASTASPNKPTVPWPRLPAPTDLPTDRPLRAGFLIVDGIYNSELIAPYDILQHTIFHTQPGIEVFTVSPDGSAVTSFEGLEIGAHHSFATAPEIDILLVPSAEHSMDTDLENETMMAWVRETGKKARFVISLCDGAFVLAQAGLLEGRAATTFPGDQDSFAERFPQVELHRAPSFVHDGPMITSQGGAKSYDPAMYLVDHLYGETVAQGVGRGLIIAWPPTAETMPAHIVSPKVPSDAG